MPDFTNKYLDHIGLAHVWQKIKGTFVAKDGDKVLSDNNYTSAEKSKLADIEVGANNYSLPTASGEVLGGMKIGAGLSIDENGIVSVTDIAPSGEIYTYRGTLNSVDDLQEIENPAGGDVYNMRDTGKNYAWVAPKDGAEGFWDDIGGAQIINALTRKDIELILGEVASAEDFAYVLANDNSLELTDNVALTAPVVIDKEFTLDLGGNTLSSAVAEPLFTVNGGKLIIKNGSIEVANKVGQAVNGGEIVIQGGEFNSSTDYGFASVGTGSKVTFEDGTINAVEGGIGAFDGATVEMNGGEMNIADNFGLFTNGSEGRGGNTIIMNGGSIVGNITSAGWGACGVYIANSDTFIMNGGEIVGNGGCGLLMRAGTVELNGGRIVAQSSENRPAGSTGWVGDKKDAAGKMNQSAVIYQESANYPGKAGMNLTINGGEFIGAVNSLEVLSNEAEPQVTVNGGVFSPAYPNE